MVEIFQEVFNDPDIPSERRRQEEVGFVLILKQLRLKKRLKIFFTIIKIHLLAVSYLNGKQLNAFNTWSTQRRKRIRAREQQLHKLSRPSREALKRLALTDNLIEQRKQAEQLPKDIRSELQAFAQKKLH